MQMRTRLSTQCKVDNCCRSPIADRVPPDCRQNFKLDPSAILFVRLCIMRYKTLSNRVLKKKILPNCMLRSPRSQSLLKRTPVCCRYLKGLRQTEPNAPTPAMRDFH